MWPKRDLIKSNAKKKKKKKKKKEEKRRKKKKKGRKPEDQNRLLTKNLICHAEEFA